MPLHTFSLHFLIFLGPNYPFFFFFFHLPSHSIYIFSPVHRSPFPLPSSTCCSNRQGSKDGAVMEEEKTHEQEDVVEQHSSEASSRTEEEGIHALDPSWKPRRERERERGYSRRRRAPSYPCHPLRMYGGIQCGGGGGQTARPPAACSLPALLATAAALSLLQLFMSLSG
jgi:hypothetical protein